MSEFESVAISSRIRFARNVSGIKFYTRLDNDKEAQYITSSVMEVLEEFGLFNFLSLSELSLNECNALFEQHLISRELIENKDISSLAISEDEKIIIMINEEDHIREQCIEKGFNLYKPFRRLSKIDDALIEKLPISFDQKIGFITASPSNLGTGMRASVMLFLPALERAGKIEVLRERAGRNELTIRGIYGEGSAPLGSFYQVSNQGAFGLSESQIIDKVSEFVYAVCNEEIEMRQFYLEYENLQIKDETMRSYGLITNCVLLDEKEMMQALSKIKFGCMLGFLDIIDENKFSKLYYEGASANIKEFMGQEKEENAVRSKYISKVIKEIVRRREK